MRDYCDQNITLDELNVYLEFDDWDKQKTWYRQDKVAKDILSTQYVVNYGKTPEDVLLERERYMLILELFDKIKQMLTKDEFMILWDFCINGRSQEEIAEKNNTYQRKISRILIKAKKKCLNVLDKSIYSEELFRPPQSTLEAHGAQHKISYPHEFLKSVSVDGEWKTSRNGHKKYISKSKCLIPEYLMDSFGDNRTFCSICLDEWGGDSCTRR